MAQRKIDPELRAALLKLAQGYEYEEREVIAGKNGKPERVRVTKRYAQPDMRAIEKIERYRSLGIWEE